MTKSQIWDAIQGGCLPIYYGADNRIYEDFPQESFIDYSRFDRPEELFSFIERMTVAEYRQRLNRCIEVNNRICKMDLEAKYRNEVCMNIVRKLREIVGHD